MTEHTNVPMMGALPPPPGITPNFVDPPSAQGGVIAVVVVSLTVSTLCAGSRTFTAFANRFANTGWDDYTSFFGWLTLIVYCVLVLESNKHGNGIHMWDVSPPEVVQLAKVANAAQIFYSLPIYLIKLSILLQYQRLFVVSHTGRTFYTIQGIIWTNLLFYIAVTFALIFACSPRERTWNPMIPGHCIHQQNIFITTAVVNIVTNLLIIIIPLNCLRKLQMPLRRKLGISMIFATGIFATVTSIIWLVKIIQYASNPDFSYNAAIVGEWTLAELAAGLVVGCMPTFPHLLRHSIPQASASLRGYWNRARNSILTSTNSRQPLAPKASWESRDPTHNYLELDERGRRDFGKDERSGDSAWGGSGREKVEDLEGGRGEGGGITKTVRVEQDLA